MSRLYVIFSLICECLGVLVLSAVALALIWANGILSGGQMSAYFKVEGLEFDLIEATALSAVQGILDRNSYYHQQILKTSPEGLALRAFEAEPPAVEGSRVFRRFMTVTAPEFSSQAIAVIDLFVGFPNYKTASVALFVVDQPYHRRGLARRILTVALPALLRQQHPAVQVISLALTENNIPALRCLLACKYQRDRSWEKSDAQGQKVMAVNFKYPTALQPSA